MVAASNAYAEPELLGVESPRPAGRVVLAEPDRDWRRAMAATLEELGYRVVQVDDGAEALECVAALEAPSLLVTNVLVSGLDGLSLVLEVKLGHPEVPILAVAGGSDRMARLHSARMFGAACALAQPFDRWEFIDAVARATAR